MTYIILFIMTLFLLNLFLALLLLLPFCTRCTSVLWWIVDIEEGSSILFYYLLLHFKTKLQ